MTKMPTPDRRRCKRPRKPGNGILAVTSCGGFFLQGEPQEKAYRESLSEAYGGLGCVDGEGLDKEIREKSKVAY